MHFCVLLMLKEGSLRRMFCINITILIKLYFKLFTDFEALLYLFNLPLSLYLIILFHNIYIYHNMIMKYNLMFFFPDVTNSQIFPTS